MTLIDQLGINIQVFVVKIRVLKLCTKGMG